MSCCFYSNDISKQSLYCIIFKLNVIDNTISTFHYATYFWEPHTSYTQKNNAEQYLADHSYHIIELDVACHSDCTDCPVIETWLPICIPSLWSNKWATQSCITAHCQDNVHDSSLAQCTETAPLQKMVHTCRISIMQFCEYFPICINACRALS